MPNPLSDNSNPQSDPEKLESAARQDIERWVDRLRRADRSLYNLMALEVWSIAQTMDNMVPGFWARFMENRRESLKQFVQDQKKQEQKKSHPEEEVGGQEEG